MYAIRSYYDERGEMVPTAIAGEHPLTLYLDKREIVTLMTLGHAPEALALGYLRNQGLVPSIEAIAAVQVDWETESVAVTTVITSYSIHYTKLYDQGRPHHNAATVI